MTNTETVPRKRGRLTAEKVSQMRLLRAKGETIRGIAKRFGVAWTGAYYAIAGKTWKSVETPVVLRPFHEEAAQGKAELILARFEDKVMPEPMSGCWLWLGAAYRRPNGEYGHARINGVSWPAHRASWSLYRGPIPEGLFVCHKCDNPTCVNPDHLFLGTASDNMQDMFSKGRHNAVYHVGERNKSAKLTEAQVREIKFGKLAPAPAAQVATTFGVSRGTIDMIRKGTTWRHIHA